MQLLLVRHGQSAQDAGETTGGDDSVLTALGWEQVQLLARRIVDENPSHFYIPPHPCSLQTFQSLHNEMGMEPFIHPMFCEHWDTGRGGWPRWRLQDAFPKFAFPAVITEQPWWPQEPETENELYARANRVLQFLKEKHSGTNDRVLVVTHAAFAGTLLSVMFCLAPCNYLRFSLRHASLNLVEVWDEGARLCSLNDVSHLPQAMWT